MTYRTARTVFVSIGLLVLVSGCGGPVPPGDDTDPPANGDPVTGLTLSGSVQDWPGGTDAIQVRDRGPFFFTSGGGVVTTLATGPIAGDGSFEVTLPGVPDGAFATLDADTLSVFGCDASGVTISPSGAALLVADFDSEAGPLTFGLQQGSSTLFVAPEPDDYRVFYVYADRDVSVEGSEDCPAIPFLLEYDLAFSEGWNTFTAVFVSQTTARNYVVSSGPPPAAAGWFLPSGSD